jgi:hypothetical protein
LQSEPERRRPDDGQRDWSRAVGDHLPRAVGVAWALAMGWLLVIGLRDHDRAFTSRFECGTDPREILRPGEMLDRISLRVIVDAHCSNARYLSDQRIALRYIGGEVDVDMTKLSIGGETYYRIDSVGDEGMP